MTSNSRIIYENENLVLKNFQNKISDLQSKENINIGNDVWIGNDVKILNGVNISNGVVIGSNSYVNKDCKPFGIYVGTPAKLIRYRFNKKIIDKIQKLSWWDWDLKKIKSNFKIFDVNIKNLNDIDFKINDGY